MSDEKVHPIEHYWEEYCEQHGLLATDRDDPRYVSFDEFEYMMRGCMRGLKEHKETEKH